MKYKYRISLGIMLFEKQDMKLLEKMAAKGWFPVYMNFFGFYKFKQDTPKDIQYSLDYNPICTTSPAFEDYTSVFAAAGWQYLFSLSNYHYFTANKGAVPLYTDASSEADKHKKINRLLIASFLVFFIASCLLLCLTVLFNFPPFIRFPVSLLGGALLGIAIAYAGAIIYHFIKQK